jgi:hypothetical protein
VTVSTAPRSHHLASFRSLEAGRTRSEPAATGAPPRLTPGAGLLLSLLLSLGLWGTIWQAASSLAAAWLR